MRGRRRASTGGAAAGRACREPEPARCSRSQRANRRRWRWRLRSTRRRERGGVRAAQGSCQHGLHWALTSHGHQPHAAGAMAQVRPGRTAQGKGKSFGFQQRFRRGAAERRHPPHRSRGWARLRCRHLKHQSCCCLLSQNRLTRARYVGACGDCRALEHLDMNAERFLIQQQIECSSSQASIVRVVRRVGRQPSQAFLITNKRSKVRVRTRGAPSPERTCGRRLPSPHR
jgi:hypothetical protein